MNIFLRELRAHRRSIIIWSVCMVIFIIMGMQKYNAFMNSALGVQELLQMFDSMPKALKVMFGLTTMDITTPIGYFGVLFFYLVLMTAIHAGMLGASIISKEERDKTVEFLMVKPVSRNAIMTSKIMAALTNIIIINLATFIPAIILISDLSKVSIANEMMISMLAMFIIQLLFMVIGVGIAAIYKNAKKAVTLTMAILLGTFFLSMAIDMIEDIEMLKFLTPFKYFDAKDFLVTGNLNIGYIILSIFIIISVLVAACKKYKNRDLNL